ncbi:MAG TPA: NAD(P)-binding domain-containing protein [Caldilineaceae bacterium]|nr:NAD(P)-binding domain-containing protein [Caldilineaceae bacterium]
MDHTTLPVAIIGAGPVGLAAAAHLLQRGETPILFEAGPAIGANVRSWAHVQLFSPWRWCVDRAAVALLEAHGWQHPDPDELPTGQDLVERYLLPLAQLPALRSQIHLNARVVAVSRRRIDKMKDAGRTNAPFVLQVAVNGQEERFLARAVIDASGTWATPNPVGADGLLAPGELVSAEHIAYGIPDVRGQDRMRYLGKRVAVVGGGHSAINAILELVDLQADDPATQISWILRKAHVAASYGGLENDQLPGRGRLGLRIKQLVEAGAVEVLTPFFITRLERAGEQVRLSGETAQGERSLLVDQVIGATGSRPDLSFLRELRLDLHSGVEAPSAIAPLIDPNVHSCGSVPPHGEKELRHPEPGFYMVGMKSYGRAPTFLLATGYEQVRSVVAALVGDWQAAAEVKLELPETGVCGLPASVDANGLGGGCCGSLAARVPTPIAFDLPVIALEPLQTIGGGGLNLAIEPSGAQELTEAAACCGVEACCTDAAPVAADRCCSPASKQQLVIVNEQAAMSKCCG